MVGYMDESVGLMNTVGGLCSRLAGVVLKELHNRGIV